MDEEFDTTAYYHVAYRPHAIMNPISEERLRFLAERCAPANARRALDIGSGKGRASLVLARALGVHTTQVDISAVWTAQARALFDAEGLADRAEIICMDAAFHPIEPRAFDVIVCLGTAAIYGGIDEALAHLVPGLTDDGILIMGEASIDRPVPKRYAAHLQEQGWLLPGTGELARLIEESGLDVLMALRSTDDEWDRYMSLQWLAVNNHARAHPDDARAREFLETARDEQEVYLRYQRHVMDWTVFVLRQQCA